MNALKGRPTEREGAKFWDILLFIVFCAALAVVFLNLRFTQDIYGVDVSGESMENTIRDGAFLYADKREEPERGDIVVIDVEKYNGQIPYFRGIGRIIKRLIALEGDTVRIEGGSVSIRAAGETEFRLLEEDYANGDTDTGEDVFEVTVGEGEIFFLGDNRGNSTDSRMVGCLKLTDIEGVVAEWSITEKPLSKLAVFFEWMKGLI